MNNMLIAVKLNTRHNVQKKNKESLLSIQQQSSTLAVVLHFSTES